MQFKIVHDLVCHPIPGFFNSVEGAAARKTTLSLGPSAPMKAVTMKYKDSNTLQPFRRLCVADKSGHGQRFTLPTRSYITREISWADSLEGASICSFLQKCAKHLIIGASAPQTHPLQIFIPGTSALDHKLRVFYECSKGRGGAENGEK